MFWQCQWMFWNNIGPSHQGWTAFDAHPKWMVSWAYCAWAVLHTHVVQHAHGRKRTKYWDTQKTFPRTEDTDARAHFGGTHEWSQRQVWRFMETCVFRGRNKLWANLYLDHSEFTQRALAKFEVKFDNAIQGLQLWLVIEVRYHHDCYVGLLFEHNCRFTTLIRTPWIHRLQRWWQNWTSYSLFCIVPLLQVMLLEWWLI